MHSFTGQVGKKHIALGGRSRKEETRDEVLERTRLERERRRQAKLEAQAATTIQSYWRRWSVARHAQQALRQAWTAQYQEQGRAVDRSALSLSQPCLPALLLLSSTGPSASGRNASATIHEDIIRLVTACRALLDAAKQPDGLLALLPCHPQHPQPAAGSTPAPPATTPVSRVVYLLAKLVSHCLAALNYLSTQSDAQQQLTAPRPTPAQLSQPSSLSPVVVLGETLLLLASSDSWAWISGVDPALNCAGYSGAAGGIGSQGSAVRWTPTSASSAVLSRLVLDSAGGSRRRPVVQGWGRTEGSTLSRTLAKMLLRSRQHAGSGVTAAGPAGAARPYAEVLTTQLVVRALALKGQGGQGLLLEQLHPTQGMHLLLCVPDLWASTPSLAPVLKHLVRLAASSLAAIPAHQIARAPHQCLLGQEDGQPCGPAASAAILLANLALGCSKALSGPGAHATALQLCTAFNRLLSVVPLQLLRGSSSTRPSTATSDEGFTTLDDPQGEEDLLCELQETVTRCPDAPAQASVFDPAAAAAASAAGRSAASAQEAGPAPRLSLPPDEMLPSELVTFMQVLSDAPGRQLLWELVSTLLPVASAADAATVSGSSSGPSLTHLPGARELCRLVRNLAAVAPNRQHMYISLALSMGFVQRMWWSVLRPLRAIQIKTGPVPVSAWLPTPTSTSASVGPSTSAQIPVSSPTASNQGAGSILWPSASGEGVSGRVVSPELDALGLLCSVYTAHLAVADVGEFFAGVPLPLTELYDCTRPSHGLLTMLKDTLWSLLWAIDGSQGSSGTAGPGRMAGQPAGVQAVAQQAATLQRRTFLRAAGGLYCTLYDRNGSGTGPGGGGKQFCPAAVFHASNLGPDRFAAEAAAARATQEGPASGHLSARTDLGFRIWQVLQYAPALVPFEERARLFQAEVAAAKQEQMEGEMRTMQEMAMMTGNFQPNRFVTIRRDQLLFDGFDKLGSLPPESLKGRVRVSFVDQHGAAEAGVDGGGLFKDFMEGLIKEGFGGDNGLFTANAQNELYPNPAAYAVVPDAPRLLTFMGRMLAKAMWEGILLELPLARFFLKKLRGGRCELRDLPSLDQQLYNNLVSLKTYKGDLSELSLTFTATHEVFGAHSEVELKPGGSQVIVTADNVGEYVARVADFRLNVEPARACAAFIQGFNELIRPEWVALFNETELQMLISGRIEGGGLDLADLRAHTNYAGGYHDDHPVMAALWEALASFTPEQQHTFLKFVTACSRAPLLGFKYLEPGLCIQMAGSMLDPECVKRLPTAATCMNLLKLPPYRDVETMRDKLLTAIMGATTFDLS